MAAQLMYADEARLSKHRAADYLNAGRSWLIPMRDMTYSYARLVQK